MIKIKPYTVVLLALLLIAPVSQALLASITVVEEANLGTEHSTISYQLEVTLENKTNTTGTFTYTIQGDSSQGTLTLTGNSNMEYTSQNMTDSDIKVNAEGSFDSGNYSMTFDADIYINMTPMMATSTIPSTVTPILSMTPLKNPLNTILQYPPSPPTTTAFEITMNVTGSTEGWFNGTCSYTETHASGSFDFTNGAMMFGLTGDVIGTFQLDSTQKTTNTTSVTDLNFTVTFDSGNPAVDQQIATYFYQTLLTYGNMLQVNENTTVDVEQNGTTVTLHYHSESTFTQVGSSPVLGNVTIQPNITVTTVPLFYENASGSFTFTLSMKSSSETKTLQATETLEASVEGINPEALTFYPTNIQVTGQINDDILAANAQIEGDGDPSAAYEIAVGLLTPFMDKKICKKTDLSATLSTDGSLHFYDLRTGEDLGTTLHITCENVRDLRFIIVGEPGLDLHQSEEGKVVVQAGEDSINLSFSVFQRAHVIEVHGKGIKISTGRVVLTTPKTFILNMDGYKVIVKAGSNTILEHGLSLQMLDETEASQIAATHGYVVAGAGVEVKGVDHGEMQITVPVETNNVVILEVHDDGSVSIITDVQVNANGTATFTTTSFSKFVPVTSSGETTTTTSETSETTTTTTQTTTTTTTTQQTTTTTTAAETTTTAPAETTTTTKTVTTTSPPPATTTTTQEETTTTGPATTPRTTTGMTTTETGKTTTSTTGTTTTGEESPSQTTTTAEKEGISTGLVAAAVIVIIIIGAAAAMMLRK